MSVNRIVLITLLAFAAISQSGLVFSQSKVDSKADIKADAKADTKSDYEFVATVNGAPITQGLLNLNIRALTTQGQKDSPELRQAVREDLINKELIAQEATKQGLSKEIDFPDQVTQLKQNLLLQAFLEDHFKKDPITDAKLREEYDRQRKLMGEGSSNIQYRISQIVVANETDAIDLVRRIQKGELFGKLAQEYSTDNGTKGQGGSLGWVLPSQVIPAVATAMVGLPKGGFTNPPIQTPGGWVIIKVDDKRNFKIPSFEESKNQIRQAIIQQYLAETVKALRANARIVQ
jgi:peptidyl-prolyl cis-trans isomerase C